ncbi:LysR family transcriptional regulator [Corynebacterium phocae]|uniref:LysR family transcriptional regulator n=1 Tax=Corynebacterium phocae TaxID=161895 RepID=A0A1L7D6H5_9CORY|nr:LysR substrate-binding domain-containing protein [Corynebacterium phocae]APT93748.1 LysR family transcriptional regulator [Corynebacterium phocae]KAA8723172.1 LysR family transcriptional regulator [Corynebacterium phocae]
MSKTLTVAFVTGTEPAKWFERYRALAGREVTLDTANADDALGQVLLGQADLALARVPDSRITEAFHIVRLYDEEPGVAVPKDSVFAELGEAVHPRDIEDEIVNYQIPPDASVDVVAVRDALQIVAANVGVAVAPRPLLKVLAKKQVVPLGLRVLEDHPRTSIALVWSKDSDSEEIQSFVGVCRGRKSSSSRGPVEKLSAREKSKAKQARRAKASAAQSEISQKSKRKRQTLSNRKNGSNRRKLR